MSQISEILEVLLSGYDSRYPNAKAHKEALAQAEAKLQALLQSAVPEKKRLEYHTAKNGATILIDKKADSKNGWNEAIDTMLNNIGGKK